MAAGAAVGAGEGTAGSAQAAEAQAPGQAACANPEGTGPEAARALHEAGSIAALQRRVEAVHREAWSRAFRGPAGPWLDHDLRRVRTQVVQLLNQQPPQRTEAAQVLLDAERRWAGVPAASWDGLAMMAAHGVAVVKPAAQVSAPQLIARLAAKGVKLAVSDTGKVIATPAGLLN